MLDVKKFVVVLLFVYINSINSITCLNDSLEQGQLVFAHVLFRHGDRTPVDPYPNDPWRERKYWPEGYGQLTNIGKKQHFNLGQFFRKRYLSILGDGTYLRDIVYVQSTDVDRTLMSVESNLAGLFPPIGNQVWDSDMRWQPVPIHTIPEKLDGVLAAKKPCNRYDQALKKYQKSPEFQALLKKYSPLFKYLEEKTGAPIKTFDQAEYLYNTLWIENLKNFTLPAWTNDVFGPGTDFEWVSNRAFQIQTNTSELARLKVGFWLREVLDRFESKIHSQLSPDRSLWIYSAHDTTVANILNSLGLFEPPHSPPYASTILFELYKTSDSYYMQLFYKNTTNENLTPLNIPSCGSKCSIEDFRKIYTSIIPTGSFEKECQISLMSMTYEEVDYRGIDGSWVALALLLLIVLVMAVASWKLVQHERNMRWYNRI